MNKEHNRFALETDALSRVTIYLINRANSKSICQFGDLTHNQHHMDGGFITGDGQVRVSGDASYVGVKPTSLQYSETMLDPSTWSWGPASGAMVIPPELCEKIIWISPYQIPTLLTNLTGQDDSVFLARALRIDKLDFDNIHGTMTRAFKENTPAAADSIPKDWKLLPIRDHNGFFVRMNVLCNDVVFEYKTFKHQNLPGIYGFRFIPKHPGVWFNTPDAHAPAGIIVLDTRISDILNVRSPANAGLIDAGDIAKLDWAVFLGHNVFYVWRPNEFQSKNTFTAALHFVAEAKKHGIEVVILRFSSFTLDGQKLLDLPAINKQAQAYNLDIPANIKSNGYVDCSIPQDVFIPRDIPVFWQNGNVTLFYGPGHMAILRNLLRAFGEKPSNTPDDVPDPQGTDMQDGENQYTFPKKKVGLLYPPSATTRINKLVKASKAAIPRISSAILRDEDADALEMALSQNGIDVLFIAYADELPEKELAAVLDLSGRTGLIVGVFSSSEVVSSGMMVMELVSQHFAVNAENANAGSVFVKNMKSKKVKKYIFGEDGKVSAVESDEDNINNPQ